MSDYPVGMSLRPIEHWPGKLTANRVASQFSAPWRSTLDLLDRELWHLGPGGRNAPAVLQIAMREQDFRRDGLPRAASRPEHPGVILTIESTKGSLSFPCDRFITWQDNMRAIALALEALRKIDRYGITPGDEQYTGWQQLPAGAAPHDTSAAELTILSFADVAVGEHRSLQEAYREAKRKVHPDRHCGDHTHSDQLETAADVLRAAGKLS